MAKDRTRTPKSPVQQGDKAPIGDSSSKACGVMRTGQDIIAYTNPLNRRIKANDDKRFAATTVTAVAKKSAAVPAPGSFSRRNRDATL